MLTEQFLASTGVPSVKAVSTNAALKDAGIFLHEFQPLAAQRSVFKKSITAANCLAASRDHVFAAQTEKAVVHVYSRLKGNQEATVPFPERISSVTLACDDTVLVLGTNEGRLYIWVIHSGRQLATGQAHLQAVTALAVDATSNFLLSASEDSTIHVWSLPDLLSFARTTDPAPVRTFSSHRAGIAALIVGHSASSANFAVSASSDKTCLIWDYRTGYALRTYLLPGIPMSLALDPADRAVYVGYDDGSLHQLALHETPDGKPDAVQNGTSVANIVQAKASTRWKVPDASHGAILALDVSFDGTNLVSGHASGSILMWDVARASFSAMQTAVPLPGPVTNLRFLPVQGLPDRHRDGQIRAPEITKPKFGAFASDNSGTVPFDYALHVQLSGIARPTSLELQETSFRQAMDAPSFPQALLDEGLCDLLAFKARGATHVNGDLSEQDDFVSLESDPAQDANAVLQTENMQLRTQLEALRRVQQASFSKIETLSKEKYALLARQRKRTGQSSEIGTNGGPNITNYDDDTSMDEVSE